MKSYDIEQREHSTEQQQNGQQNQRWRTQYEGNLLKMAANQKFQFQPFYENKMNFFFRILLTLKIHSIS